MTESAVVEGQRALQESHTGKGHESEAIGFGRLNQVHCGEFCACEAVRRDVLGLHAPGGVDGEDDIQAPLLDLLECKAPLGTGQSDDEKAGGQGQAAKTQVLASRGNA